MTTAEEKRRSLAAAVAWRRAVPGIVVFTNGVFDLVHPGHVHLLESARAEGDALLVAINSDASARLLAKGPGRPVATEEARARVLAAFAAVDCIVLFDEPTPLNAIAALEPDVLVKGADYRRESIVGGDLVEARGGRVVRVPLLAGYSSTSLAERLRVPT